MSASKSTATTDVHHPSGRGLCCASRALPGDKAGATRCLPALSSPAFKLLAANKGAKGEPRSEGGGCLAKWEDSSIRRCESKTFGWGQIWSCCRKQASIANVVKKFMAWQEEQEELGKNAKGFISFV